ncbi:MAG: hypothetical protein ACT4P3_01755 [Betaproteobacteria bacterium]
MRHAADSARDAHGGARSSAGQRPEIDLRRGKRRDRHNDSDACAFGFVERRDGGAAGKPEKHDGG